MYVPATLSLDKSLHKYDLNVHSTLSLMTRRTRLHVSNDKDQNTDVLRMKAQLNVQPVLFHATLLASGAC